MARFNAMLDNDERVGYLRAKAIGSLIYQVVDAFQHNEKDILSGRFDTALTETIESASDLESMKVEMREKVYGITEVIEVEAAGFEVLGGLLEMFLTAVIDQPDSKHSAKVVSLMARANYNSKWVQPETFYDTLLSVSELVGGMTDYAAIDLYRKLKGIELPNY
jgi:dGTPase